MHRIPACEKGVRAIQWLLEVDPAIRWQTLRDLVGASNGDQARAEQGRTGEIINPVFLRLSFPPRWHYDILRALDYFQAVNAPRDERLAEAIQIVRSCQGKGGRWPLQKTYKGKTYFTMER